jgi:hypothetical protein
VSPKNAEDTTPLPVPEEKEEAENLQAHEEMAEQTQSVPGPAEPSTLTTDEANEDTETKHVTEEETTQVEKSSVPMLPARNNSSPDRDEDHEAPIMFEEIKARGGPSQIEKSAENQEPSTASNNMEMDAPALTEVSNKPEDVAITVTETTRINSLDETTPTVVEETADAMDVDAALDASLKDTIEQIETEKVEVIENNVTVNEEVQTRITNVQEETSASVQVKAVQETSLIQLQETLEDNAESSIINSTEGLSGEGDAEAGKTQEFHDAMMQDAPSENATGKPAINTIVVEDAEEHSTKDGQLSPPATHFSQVQNLQEDTINVAAHDHGQHLLTPSETQVRQVDMSDILQTTAYNDETDEEDANPEDQIMAEILQHSPTKQDTHLPIESVAFPPAASQTKPFTQTEQADETHEGPASQSEPEHVAAVAKSLRPQRSKLNRASGYIDQEDPSMALIAATPAKESANSGSKHSSPAPVGPSSKTRSKTRSKTHDDPSIQLAGALEQSETKNKRKRKAADDESITSLDNSPSGTRRVLRSMTDHDDLSILLAKGSSPPARQTRPDLKRETPVRETRSVSRSLRLQEESPDASFASLISPSIAGSFATVPEDGEEDVKSLKLRLAKNLRTDFPDFLPLKSLRGNIDKMTDVLAVVTQTPPQPHRPKQGRPRGFMLTLTLTDPSTAPTQVRVANIFRPHLTSLPEVESGDIILLRRVKVVSMTGRNFGVRSEDLSPWAVFKPNGEQALSQVKGPPVEITPEEIEHAKGLRQWWSLQDDNAMNKIRKVTESKENAK